MVTVGWPCPRLLLFAFQMDRQQHGTGFSGSHVMSHVRVQNQDVPRAQFMITSFRLHCQTSFQNVNRHQSVRYVVLQRAAGLKGKKYLRDAHMFKNRYLAMPAFRRGRFRAQITQDRSQIDNVAFPGKALNWAWAQPFLLITCVLFGHDGTSMMSQEHTREIFLDSKYSRYGHVKL